MRQEGRWGRRGMRGKPFSCPAHRRQRAMLKAATSAGASGGLVHEDKDHVAC